MSADFTETKTSGNDQACSLEPLLDVLASLLGPAGCPWDKEQTPSSLCEYLAEECFELIDAVRRGEVDDVRDEMGDVLFLLLFLARLYRERFSFDQVIAGAAAKLVRRHPHVFAGRECRSREQLLNTWEAVKKQEKAAKEAPVGDEPTSGGVFASLPRDTPPLIKAYRIHAKAARANFTWDEDADVEQQVEAEWLELLDALNGKDKAAQEHELGDLLFSLVELGRRKGIKANEALDKSALRFLDRFALMEQAARAHDQDFAALNMDDKNRLWEEAKARSRGREP